MSEKFDKKEYNREYQKKHRKEKLQWKVDLPIKEKEEYDDLLKQHGITKIDFLRNSFKKFREENEIEKGEMKMKKIKFEELGKYFKEEAEKEFGGWYSDDTNDWEEDIRSAQNNANYNENDGIYECHVEVTKNERAPLLIDFYYKEIELEDGNIDCEYYID